MIDTEAKDITIKLLALEEPIDQQIKLEEARKEEIRTAVVRAEAARLAAEAEGRRMVEEKDLVLN